MFIQIANCNRLILSCGRSLGTLAGRIGFKPTSFSLVTVLALRLTCLLTGNLFLRCGAESKNSIQLYLKSKYKINRFQYGVEKLSIYYRVKNDTKLTHSNRFLSFVLQEFDIKVQHFLTTWLGTGNVWKLCASKKGESNVLERLGYSLFLQT